VTFVKGFVICICISKIQHNARSQLQRSDVICEQLFYCRIRLEGLWWRLAIDNPMVLISEVALRRARLVPGWVTVLG